jgi:hypothetical protein
MLPHKGLDRRRRIHVSDRHDHLIRAGLLELGPAFKRLVEVRHVGHRATRPQVGQNHAHVLVGEDVRRLRHKVHAAEYDVLDALLLGRLARQLERIAREIGEIDHRVLLVVMPQDYQLVAQVLLGRLDAQAQLGVGKFSVYRREGLLPGFDHREITFCLAL